MEPRLIGQPQELAGCHCAVLTNKVMCDPALRCFVVNVQVSDVVETGHGYEVSLHYGAIGVTQQTATTTGGLGTPQTSVARTRAGD